MKQPFKLGDMVAVYDCDGRHSGGVILLNPDLAGMVTVKLLRHPDILSGTYHIKQCRHLVKKKRREIWVNEDDIINKRRLNFVWDERAGEPGYIRFIEAKRDE